MNKNNQKVKTFESINTEINLCDSCESSYPKCEGIIKFGKSTGGDNICGCTEYSSLLPNDEVEVIELLLDNEEFESQYQV